MVVFHFLGMEGFHRNLLSFRQLGNRVSHDGSRSQVDIELLFLIRFQNEMGTVDRAAGGRFTRSRLDLDEFSGKRNDFRLHRLSCDTRRISYSLLGIGPRCDCYQKDDDCCQHCFVSHGDSPVD